MSKRKMRASKKMIACTGAIALLTVAGVGVINSFLAASAINTFDVTGYDSSNTTKITQTVIHSGAIPSGYGSAQGFAITNNHYAVVLTPVGGNYDNSQQNTILYLNKTTFVNESHGEKYYLGHGNDATYNSKNGTIAVTSCLRDEAREENPGQITFIDADTFQEIEKRNHVGPNGEKQYNCGIAYDEDEDIYFAPSGNHVRVIDNNFIGRVRFYSNYYDVLTVQGFGYHSGYAYHLFTVPSSDNRFPNSHSFIVQYGSDGSAITGTYYVDTECEIEAAAFDGDEMYILYNQCNEGQLQNGYYTIAKVNNVRDINHQYDISFNANGGSWSGDAPSISTYVGREVTIPRGAPTRDGYTFLGYANSRSAQAADYAVGGSYKKNYGADNDNVTLYAVWQRNADPDPDPDPDPADDGGEGEVTPDNPNTSAAKIQTELAIFGLGLGAAVAAVVISIRHKR